MTKKELVLATVEDMVTDFLHYDRDNDEDLEHGDIELLIESGELTVEEIVEKFKVSLFASLN